MSVISASILRRIGSRLLMILMVSTLLAIGVAQNAGATKGPAVYLVPHQDDETISMGADIAAHVKAGRDVRVVLVTNGDASKARDTICKKTGQCLTKAVFSRARDREFIAALGRLGVPAKNISFERIGDGTTTREIASSIVDKYIALYPVASFKTMSWLDRHVDHHTLGHALNDRCVKKRITDCRFLQSPLYQRNSTIAIAPIVTPKGGKYRVANEVRAAVNEYKLWKPSAGRYAIGYYSVKSQLDYTYKNYHSLYHMDNNNWLSGSDKLSASIWINANQ